jgi:hypothetical protein
MYSFFVVVVNTGSHYVGQASLKFFFPLFLVVLGFEFKDSHLLGRPST